MKMTLATGLREEFIRKREIKTVILHVVTICFGIKINQLISPTRSKSDIAVARQVAMYLAHTTGGYSQYEVGSLFHRDRTTVAHACRVIEDRRDNYNFDKTIAMLEESVRILLLEMPHNSGR